MSWLSRTTNLFRGGKVNRDLNEELQFHIDERIAELIRSGRSREDAEREARRIFGSPLRMREESREIKLAPRLESIIRDVRFGARMLARSPIVTGAAILSLSLAIGACTAAFSLIDALILRPLPVKDPQSLVYLTGVTNGRDVRIEGYPLFERLHDRAREYLDLFAVSSVSNQWPASFEQSGRQEEKVRAQFVSGDMFSQLGIGSSFGRVLTADDDRAGAHPAAVISHSLWQHRFAGDTGVIGRSVSIQKRSFEIVGVAQEGFWGVEPGYQVDLWIPIAISETGTLAESGTIQHLGRLKRGMQPEQAAAALQPAYYEFLRETSFNRSTREQTKQGSQKAIGVRSAAAGTSTMRKEFARPLAILAVVACLVLLIACSNIANLLIARAAGREREMALRVSIGAGRERLIQQLLIESLLLTTAASILALVFSAVTAPAIVTLLSTADNPAYLDLRIDWRIGIFVGLLGLFTTILFGLAPALRASAASPNRVLKGDSQKQSIGIGPFRPLIAVQVAFSFIVLFLAGLLLSTFQKLTTLDPGFEKNKLLTFDLDMEALDSSKQARSLSLQLQDQIRQINGVEAASLSAWSLFSQNMLLSKIRLPGSNEVVSDAWLLPVSPGFFATMGIPLMEGREFDPRDLAPEQPTAIIINEALAQAAFPDGNALGRALVGIARKDTPREIVGVVHNAKYRSLRDQDPPTVYVPYELKGYRSLQVRTSVDPSIMIATLSDEVKRVHPAIKITGMTLQSTLIRNSLLRERLLALLSGFFAIVALTLGAVGLYGVLHYAVVRRTREIGIRMALGARGLTVVRLVIADITLFVLVGLAAGIGGGLWLARFVATLLFDVQPFAFWSLALPILCLLSAAVLASAPPSLRAVQVDPIEALRHE